MKSLRNLATIVGSIVALSLGGCGEKEYTISRYTISSDDGESDDKSRVKAAEFNQKNYENELESKADEYKKRLNQAKNSFLDYCIEYQIFDRGKGLTKENYTKHIEINRDFLKMVIDSCKDTSLNPTSHNLIISVNSDILSRSEQCAKAQQEYDKVVNILSSLPPYGQIKECVQLDENAERIGILFEFRACINNVFADRQDTYAGQKSAWREYASQDFEKYCASPISKIKALETGVAKLRRH